jgi:diketogulonate reductase-like aldo/keto reductase
VTARAVVQAHPRQAAPLPIPPRAGEAATRRHGLAVTAYSPIARGRAVNDKTLRLIGMHHRKTASQVALRNFAQLASRV